MGPDDLKFDTPNNAAMSLRFLAEFIRISKARVVKTEYGKSAILMDRDPEPTVTITITMPV